MTRRPSWVSRASRLVDHVFEVFSPARAFQRRQVREMMLGGAKAGSWTDSSSSPTSHDGARQDRLRDGWNRRAGSPDQALLPDLMILRERSRDLVRNTVAGGIVSSMVDNVIGTGLRPQSSVNAKRLGITDAQAEAWQDAVEASWERWTRKENADATQRETFGGIQRLAYRSKLESGDSFVHFTRGRDGLALEVIEADRVDTPTEAGVVLNPFFYDDSTNPRMGVLLGQNGEHAAYVVCRKHPGLLVNTVLEDWRRINRLDAAGRVQMVQLCTQKRPGLNRGDPLLTPVIAKLDHLANLDEAMLVRARVEACFAGFVKKMNAAAAAIGRSGGRTDSSGARIEELVPGTVEYLNPDEDIVFSAPQSPGSGYDPFTASLNRSIATALQLSYELVSKDYRSSTYSSSRQALIEVRRMWRCEQESVAVHLCQPVWERRIEEAWLRGELPDVPLYDDFEGWTRALWMTPAEDWIDPVKEVEAAGLRIDRGLSTLAEEASKQNRDWEEIIRQRAKENELAKELGVSLVPAKSGAAAPPGQDNSGPEQARPMPAAAGAR